MKKVFFIMVLLSISGCDKKELSKEIINDNFICDLNLQTNATINWSIYKAKDKEYFISDIEDDKFRISLSVSENLINIEIYSVKWYYYLTTEKIISGPCSKKLYDFLFNRYIINTRNELLKTLNKYKGNPKLIG